MSMRVNARSISMIGVLVAIEMILARFFTIHTWNLKIGFSFIPIVVAAIFFGPLAAGLVAAIGDVFSAILFPVGAFFPGFTLTAFLTGVVFGVCFRKTVSVRNVIVAVLLVQGIGSQLINTYWISMLYGSPFVPLFITRVYQTVVMCIVEIVCIILINKKIIPVLRQAVN